MFNNKSTIAPPPEATLKGFKQAKRAVKQIGCIDTKRHRLLRFELFKKIEKILSLNLLNFFISPLEGEKKFLSELCELRNFREGYNLKYSCPVQHETVIEPSPAFVMLTKVRKRLLPLTKREGSDSVIINNFFDTNHSQLTTHNSLISNMVFSRFTSHFSHKRTAFTLAEVLITLGIIGIVAALTIPTLTANIRRAELKNRFKKTDSIVTQAIQKTVQELGYNKFDDLDIPITTPDSEIQNIYDNYNSIFLSQFKIVKTIKPCYTRGVPRLKGYFLENDSYRQYGWQYGGSNESIAYILADGSSISQLTYLKGTTDVMPSITIDTNGPFKGPNAYGYDLFFIKSERNERRTSGMLCDPFIQNTANLSGCYWYARKDTSALNNLDYWEVLYHKQDYWKKLRNK